MQWGLLIAGGKIWNPTLLLLHDSPVLLTSVAERLGLPVRVAYAIRNSIDVTATDISPTLPSDPAHVATVRTILFDRPRRTSADLEWSLADLADSQARRADNECQARYAEELPTGQIGKAHS